jgi:hypothetical protein
VGCNPKFLVFFIFTMSHFDWPHHKIIYTTLVGHSPKWKFTYPKGNFRSECLWPHQYREISNLDKGYKVWWCYWEHLGGTCLRLENMLAMNWEHDENTLGTWCEHIENSSQTPWEIQNPQKLIPTIAPLPSPQIRKETRPLGFMAHNLIEWVEFVFLIMFLTHFCLRLITPSLILGTYLSYILKKKGKIKETSICKSSII